MRLNQLLLRQTGKHKLSKEAFIKLKLWGYEKAGLNVVIRGGGPGINIPQLLGAQAIDFAMGSNSFILLNMAQAEFLPVLSWPLSKGSEVLITHEQDDIKSISDMKDKPIMIADASINALGLDARALWFFR